jgi:hypothetical protein
MSGQAAPASVSPLPRSEEPEDRSWLGLCPECAALRWYASIRPGVMTMEHTWSPRSFHMFFLLDQYEMDAIHLMLYSGVAGLSLGKPVWDAELEGVKLLSVTTDSVADDAACLILIAGKVSGTSSSSSSSSSLEDSDSEAELSEVESSLDETSEGRYSCFSGEDVRRFTRPEAGSSTGGLIGEGFGGASVR